jgi:NIMA (never in mitosis gene a)-related kinase
VVSYRESFIDEASRTVCMIMDLAEDGDMTDKIQKHIKKGTSFPEYELWSILI